jgi:hypothetical protein
VVEGAAERIRITVELQRCRQSAAGRPWNATLGDEAIEAAAGCGRGAEFGDRPVAIGHGQTLAPGDEAEVPAEVASEFRDTH